MADAFFEIQFPPQISYGAKGGPTKSTDVVILSGGAEFRNANWDKARMKWDVSTGLKRDIDVQELLAFFYAMDARATGFRFKDWSDYKALSAGQSNVGASYTGAGLTTNVANYGILVGTVDGTNTAFQLAKLYTVTSPYTSVVKSYQRPILKPAYYGAWDGTPTTHPDGTPAIALKPYHNGTPVATSDFTIDYTTGIVTFTSAPTHATITSPSGFEITCDFEFDVPARFDNDALELSMDNFDNNTWQNIMIFELREPE